MGFLESLMKQKQGDSQAAGGLGGLISMVSSNPQILSAITGLLSSRDTSIGGSGGLAGLVNSFNQKGLGSVMSSWISRGPNPPISPDQVNDVLGQDTVNQFAAKAGVPATQASSVLAGLLPNVVDQVTPEGHLPDNDTLENSLKSLLGNLGGR